MLLLLALPYVTRLRMRVHSDDNLTRITHDMQEVATICIRPSRKSSTPGSLLLE